MNYRLIVSLLICVSGTGMAAQTAWISDQLRTSVIASPESGARFLGTIRAGEQVTVLERRGDYVRIKTPEINGWVLARYIINTESIHSLHEREQAELSELSAENQQLKNEKEQHVQTIAKLKQDFSTAKENEETAKAELIALQRAASNVVAIDQRNRELQAAVVSLEQENLTLKHKNLRLSEDINQRQMYAGGLLVLAGFILNWLGSFFRLTGRRRRSFDDL